MFSFAPISHFMVNVLIIQLPTTKAVDLSHPTIVSLHVSHQHCVGKAMSTAMLLQSSNSQLYAANHHPFMHVMVCPYIFLTLSLGVSTASYLIIHKTIIPPGIFTQGTFIIIITIITLFRISCCSQISLATYFNSEYLAPVLLFMDSPVKLEDELLFTVALLLISLPNLPDELVNTQPSFYSSCLLGSR